MSLAILDLIVDIASSFIRFLVDIQYVVGYARHPSHLNGVFNTAFPFVTGLTNLTTLSFRNSNLITAAAMTHLSELVNLTSLDLEKCPKIHGGLAHLKGM